jgi:hypothetical protein
MSRALLILLAVVFATTGCTHAGHAASAAAPAAAPQASTEAPQGDGMTGMCPMSIPGTQVAAKDTSTGEALTFTTTSPGQVPALREKVHAMADMHNRHHASGEEQAGMGGMMHGGMMGGGDMPMMEMPPPSHAAVEDLPEGARIVVTPNDSADRQRLQSTIRSHAEQMQQHGCGVMMEHSQHGS